MNGRLQSSRIVASTCNVIANRSTAWTLIRLIRSGFEKVHDFDMQFFRRFGTRTLCLYGRNDNWSPMEDGLFLHDRRLCRVGKWSKLTHFHQMMTASTPENQE